MKISLRMALILFFSIVLLGWLAWSVLVVRNLEEPKYTVTEQNNAYEIRQYATHIVAETTVQGAYDRSLNQGFMIIADYIFGNNTTRSSIAMTTPVGESRNGASEEIAMTVPVGEEQKEENMRVISFVMPAKYTLETLPQPNDARVRLQQVPERKIAALRFSWFATEARVEAKKKELLDTLTKAGVEIIGTPQIAQYNPPFTIPFLRRNEILVEVR